MVYICGINAGMFTRALINTLIFIKIAYIESIKFLKCKLYFISHFQEEAIKMAWEFLTVTLKLDEERLYVTYFGGDDHLGLIPDDECKQIWINMGYVTTVFS